MKPFLSVRIGILWSPAGLSAQNASPLRPVAFNVIFTHCTKFSRLVFFFFFFFFFFKPGVGSSAVAADGGVPVGTHSSNGGRFLSVLYRDPLARSPHPSGGGGCREVARAGLGLEISPRPFLYVSLKGGKAQLITLTFSGEQTLCPPFLAAHLPSAIFRLYSGFTACSLTPGHTEGFCQSGPVTSYQRVVRLLMLGRRKSINWEFI